MAPSAFLAALLPASGTSGLGLVVDDVSQLWLTNSSDTLTAVGLIESHATEVGLGQISYGPSLETIFELPCRTFLVPAAVWRKAVTRVHPTSSRYRTWASSAPEGSKSSPSMAASLTAIRRQFLCGQGLAYPTQVLEN
jgi:hypothetical protein